MRKIFITTNSILLFAMPVTVNAQNAPYTEAQPIKRIVEAVPHSADDNTHIQEGRVYGDYEIVRAQHIKPGDVSPEEYQQLLDEADRIKAYRRQAGSYGYQSSPEVTQNQDLELYSYEQNAIDSQVTTDDYAVAIAPAIMVHRVVKGDTLYSLSKRYNTGIADIQAANGMSGTALSLGQTLSIPNSNYQLNSYSTSDTPAYAMGSAVSGYPAPDSSNLYSGRVTSYPLQRVIEPVEVDTTSIYAVLPQDTLYSISRTTCTAIGDIILMNNISNPDVLKPGQRLALPEGHCLTR